MIIKNNNINNDANDGDNDDDNDIMIMIVIVITFLITNLIYDTASHVLDTKLVQWKCIVKNWRKC